MAGIRELRKEAAELGITNYGKYQKDALEKLVNEKRFIKNTTPIATCPTSPAAKQGDGEA